MPNFTSSDDFIWYLRNTLIPDLRASGSDGHVEDYEEAIYWITFYKMKIRREHG